MRLLLLLRKSQINLFTGATQKDTRSRGGSRRSSPALPHTAPAVPTPAPAAPLAGERLSLFDRRADPAPAAPTAPAPPHVPENVVAAVRRGSYSPDLLLQHTGETMPTTTAARLVELASGPDGAPRLSAAEAASLVQAIPSADAAGIPLRPLLSAFHYEHAQSLLDGGSGATGQRIEVDPVDAKIHASQARALAGPTAPLSPAQEQLLTRLGLHTPRPVLPAPDTAPLQATYGEWKTAHHAGLQALHAYHGRDDLSDAEREAGLHQHLAYLPPQTAYPGSGPLRQDRARVHDALARSIEAREPHRREEAWLADRNKARWDRIEKVWFPIRTGRDWGRTGSAEVHAALAELPPPGHIPALETVREGLEAYLPKARENDAENAARDAARQGIEHQQQAARDGATPHPDAAPRVAPLGHPLPFVDWGRDNIPAVAATVQALKEESDPAKLREMLRTLPWPSEVQGIESLRHPIEDRLRSVDTEAPGGSPFHPPGAGWIPIPGSKKGGYHRRKPTGGYEYWYPGDLSARERHLEEMDNRVPHTFASDEQLAKRLRRMDPRLSHHHAAHLASAWHQQQAPRENPTAAWGAFTADPHQLLHAADWRPPHASDGWSPPLFPERGTWAERIADGAPLPPDKAPEVALSIIPPDQVARIERYRAPGKDKDPIPVPDGMPDLKAGWEQLAQDFYDASQEALHAGATRGQMVALYEQGGFAQRAAALRAALEAADAASGRDSSQVLTYSGSFSRSNQYEFNEERRRWMKIQGTTGHGERISATGPLTQKQTARPTPTAVHEVEPQQAQHAWGTKLKLAEAKRKTRGDGAGEANLAQYAPDLLFLKTDAAGDFPPADGDRTAWDAAGLGEAFHWPGANSPRWPYQFTRDMVGKDFEKLSSKQQQWLSRFQDDFEKRWNTLPLTRKREIYEQYFHPHLEGARFWPDDPAKQDGTAHWPAGVSPTWNGKPWAPHDYQNKAVNWYTGLDTPGGHPRGNYYMEMGLGKTPVALLTYHRLREAGQAERCLVVAPTSTHSSWLEHADALSDAGLKIVSGDRKKKERLIKEWGEGKHQILVITPESLASKGMLEHIHAAMGVTDGEPSERSTKTLRIADEVHKFSNPEATRTQVARQIFDLPGANLGMTGTPQPNNPSNLFHIQRFINHTAFLPEGAKRDPDAADPTKRASLDRTAEDEFLNRFARWREFEVGSGYRKHTIRRAVGYISQRQDEVRKRLSENAFVRTLDDPDVAVSLPSMNAVSPYLPPSENQDKASAHFLFFSAWEEQVRRLQRKAEHEDDPYRAAMYAEAARAEAETMHRTAHESKDVMAQVGYHARVGNSRAVIHGLKMMAISPEVNLRNRDRDGGEVAAEDKGKLWRDLVGEGGRLTPKLEHVLEKAEEYTTNHPGKTPILMAEYPEALEIVREELVRRGVHPDDIGVLKGGQPQKNLEIQKKYNEGAYRYVLASTGAMETGANLQKQGAFLAHLSTPYNPSSLAQATARVWRQGQQYPTTVLRPIGSPVERTIDGIIGKKITQSAQSVGMGAGERQIVQSLFRRPDEQAMGLDEYQAKAAEQVAEALEGRGSAMELAAALGADRKKLDEARSRVEAALAKGEVMKRESLQKGRRLILGLMLGHA